MWPNPQELADLVTFTEEILTENFIFCAVWKKMILMVFTFVWKQSKW